MELDDIKTAWRELDRRMEVIDLRQKHAQRRHMSEGLRGWLRRFGGALVVELVCNAGAMALLGSFIFEHRHEFSFAAPAIVLDLAALAGIAVGVVQLGLLARIDYSGPVTLIQRQLARVRVLRVRSVQWTLLAAPLLWMPLAIVCARGLLGIDLYSGLGASYIAANIGFGILVIPLGIWIARKCAPHLCGSPFLKRLADAVAGYSLTRAQSVVHDIENFEQEV